MKGSSKASVVLVVLITASLLSFLPCCVEAGEIFSPEDVPKLKFGSNAAISPDGKHIAYTVHITRSPEDKAGSAYSELHVVSVASGKNRPFITGKVNLSSPRWSPNGALIAFLTKRGEKAKTQVWAIPSDGGEAYKVTSSKANVTGFRWHPNSQKIAYIATSPASKLEEKLKKKGYDFVFFEENLKHRNLYIIDASRGSEKAEAEQLTENTTVWSFEFSPDGNTIAAAVSDKNLVDYRYMFQKIHLIDVDSKTSVQLTDNPGKLGNYAFSPDGKKLVYTASRERADHAISQLLVIDASGGTARNLTPSDFRGNVTWAGWKNNSTILYLAGEGVWATLNTIKSSGDKQKVILNSRKTGIFFGSPTYTKDFKHFSWTGSSPEIPLDIFYWKPGSRPKRLTTLNPWIANRKLGRQEVIQYKARDGQQIEGILVYPVDYEEGIAYPLIVTVHGGPESHYSNRWLTGYFQPAQVLAGQGYAVFHPNYRASTGYGVDFGMAGLNDAAGTEFDDVADAIDFLVNKGIADRKRVGLGGGSYGGFAAAWFSSYYTKYIKAACMFVGISNLISKRGTTDIPYEELYVHSGQPLEEMWEKNLKRSPIYWAHQSRTAVLILGGSADTRVHPSQSLEYYRRLKMNKHQAVRLVQYPGEGHGNRKQPGRTDVLLRSLQWFNWYVRDDQPLDGPMPPLDISDSYGLKLEE